ncbi:MAG: DUF1805 domain-containing protein [Candidatus Omnitrophota bacterium]
MPPLKIKCRKIKCGRKRIDAFCIKLMSKNLILFLGSKGYVMCGYLNMRSADKFKDAAVKITGVSTINESLKADAGSLSREAKKLGIYKGQPIKEVLKIIA